MVSSKFARYPLLIKQQGNPQRVGYVFTYFLDPYWCRRRSRKELIVLVLGFRDRRPGLGLRRVQVAS